LSSLNLLKKEEEKNKAYIEQINTLRITPSSSTNLAAAKSEQQIFILNGDIGDYSKITSVVQPLYPATQSFLNTLKEEVSANKLNEVVKLAGDGILVFFTNGEELVWIAEMILHRFRDFNRKLDNSFTGMRIVLGYGICFKEQKGEWIDFVGDPVVETCRVDQVMKKHIKSKGEDEASSQIWCTEAFYSQLKGKSSDFTFKPLGEMDLDKGYGKKKLYQVIFN